MGATTIEWTDASWQVTTGCEEVSPGCGKCYARTMAKRLRAMALADIEAGRDPGKKRRYIDAVDDAGRWTGLVTTNEDSLSEPLSWRKPRMIFVDSMSDLFHKDVPFEFIDQVIVVMALTPQHTYQVLTKRPERMAEYCYRIHNQDTWIEHACHSLGRDGDARRIYNLDPSRGLPNVWLGTSVENQAAADERLPHLRRCPAAVRFLSVEPMLGPINFRFAPMIAGVRDSHFVWCIFGCESGPQRRTCELDWIRNGIRQCRVAGIAPFVKQIPVNGRVSHDPEEWPEDLRVRSFPAAQHEAPRTGREED
jgi:protein gp37